MQSKRKRVTGNQDKSRGQKKSGAKCPKEGKTPGPIPAFDIRNYGKYAIALKCSEDLPGMIMNYFSVLQARQMYALSLIYFVEGYLPEACIQELFEQSVLSEKWPQLPLSKGSIRFLLTQLGQHNLLTEKFQQSLISQGSGLIVFKALFPLSCQNQEDYSGDDPKALACPDDYRKLLIAYDGESRHPLTCKAFEGNLPEKNLIQEWFEIYHVSSGTTFILDQSFYSQENLEACRTNNGFFLIPVPEHTFLSQRMRGTITFTGCFPYVHTDENGREECDTILYRETTVAELEALGELLEKEEEEEDDEKGEANPKKPGRDGQEIPKAKIPDPCSCQDRHSAPSLPSQDRVILYRSEAMYHKLACGDLSWIEEDNEGAEEKYRELEPSFIFILRLNTTGTAQEEYYKYKKRWDVGLELKNLFQDVLINQEELPEKREAAPEDIFKKREANPEDPFEYMQGHGSLLEDYYTAQGLSFLLLLEDMICHRFLKARSAAPSESLRHMTKRECLLKARQAEIICTCDGKWHGNRISPEAARILRELGISREEDLEKLNKHIY